MWIVFEQTATGTFYICSYDTAAGLVFYGSSGGNGPSSNARGVVATWGTNLLNTAKTVSVSGTAGPGSASGTSTVNVDNSGSPVSATGTYSSTIPASAVFSLFSGGAGAFPVTGKIARVIVANALATSTQNTQMQSYLFTEYGV
jgi:hypothetical protein